MLSGRVDRANTAWEGNLPLTTYVVKIEMFADSRVKPTEPAERMSAMQYNRVLQRAQ